MPPRPGALVHRATGEERAQALYFDQMDRKVPIGLGRDGDPIYLNLEFLDGTRGAHVSISGISGVATKTSFALFLLLLDLPAPGCSASGRSTPRRWCSPSRARTCCSSTTPTRRLDDDLRADYAELGPARRAVRLGRVLRPADPGRPRPAARTSPAAPAASTAFWWTLAEFCAGELLPYVFADAEDERNQYTMVDPPGRRPAAPGGRRAGQRRRGVASTGRPAAHLRRAGRRSSSTGSPTTTTRRDWAGPVTGIGHGQRVPAPAAVVAQAAARARSAATCPTPARRRDHHREPAGHRGRPAQPARSARSGSWSASCSPPRPRARRRPGAGGLLFTMLDELNKYAPREGSSPIKEVLLDIAERGRSLGIILIGAQQTASEVERRIVSNSSIKVVGRLDPAEAGRPEYGFLPPAQRTAGDAGQAGHDVRLASRRSRCRWPSSSRSRPGPPGCPSAATPPPAPATRARPADATPAVAARCRTPAVDDPTRRSERRRRSDAPPPGGRAMKILHTSDWHVGKTLKGRSRLDEQERCSREIVGIAREHEVDAVLVAGDLYDTRRADRRRAAAGGPHAARRCASTGVEVDRDRRQPRPRRHVRRVPRRSTEAAGITLVGTVRTAEQRRRGRVHRPVDRRAGDGRRAAVPVPALRGAGRRADRAAPRPRTPAPTTSMVRDILGQPRPRRSRDGRGEPGDGAPDRARRHVRRRRAGRAVDLRVRACRPAIFPADAHYVALGHLHRRQTHRRRRARCTTAGRRWPSTSASRTTRRVVCLVEAAPDHARRGHRRADHRPGGGCARCAAPSPSCRRSATMVGDDCLRV